ncbi:hypothetical protein GCM10008995_07560 [Halobellus salinus]|uniref:Uncharacterized protein n=1 Tax=Halobellus salinus TaxID=931585 RepID=A0A830E8E5_9EURY|nr:hypothetical protein [Halobellus salinus]GGJ00209.1 hypothetical protein GCM10008995_07560 [Halobellus salinus]SMP01860.1 hypothetical protein SAMN06265347_101152 [Halobellus salinus]
MADVRRPSGRRPSGAGRSGGDDRAQLLLVGALALAVVFVALALLLNTAIYTGTLATRDSGVEATPAIEYVSASRRAGVDAVASVNRRNNTSAAELNRALNATMGEWDDLASSHRAVVGDAADVDVTGVTNGTRIQQDDAGRNFTGGGSADDWTVVSGGSNVRSMRFSVEESTLTDDPADLRADDVFHVNVTSGAGTRSVFVYDTPTGPEIRVDDGGTETICVVGSVTSGTFSIDVPNESVGGAPCPALGPVDNTSGPVDINYRDGGAANGTYTMVVDEPPAVLSLSGLNDTGPSPYWTDAVYGAELTVTYRTVELDYEATVEVVPE